MMRKIVDVFAEYELLVIRLRTRVGLAAKKRRGERTGNVPYGFDLVDDGRRSKPKKGKKGQEMGNRPIKLEVNPNEMNVLAWMLTARRAKWTYHRITWCLNHNEVKTKQGKPWACSSVKYILKELESDPCHPAYEILARVPGGPSLSPTSSGASSSNPDAPITPSPLRPASTPEPSAASCAPSEHGPSTPPIASPISSVSSS